MPDDRLCFSCRQKDVPVQKLELDHKNRGKGHKAGDLVFPERGRGNGKRQNHQSLCPWVKTMYQA